MPNKDKNIPKRRFKEFENADAWELRKLGELGEIVTGSTPPIANEEYYSDKGIPWITPTDIETNIISDSAKKLSAEGAKIGRVVRANSILCTCIASIGKNALLTTNGSFNQQINSLTPYSDNDSYFLLTSSELWSIQMKQIASSGTMQIVNKTEFSELRTMIPSLPEQEAIGTFFSTLDCHITLHQRKLDKLKSVKQAYLSEMFPAEGERVPKRRFPGFTDDWELRKLGEVGTVAMCRRIFKEQTSEHGEIPFYKIGTFGGPPDAFIARELFEEFKDKYSYPNIGDILISASGSIGRAVEFLGEDEYFQDSNIVWLKHDGKINNIFLKQFYSIVKWSGIEGSTIKRLYNENILNTEIALPTLPEQEAIGNFFSTLDRHITLHQRKLEKLKNLKKALLNELFV